MRFRLVHIAVASIALTSAALAYGEPPRHPRPAQPRASAPKATNAPKAYQQAMVGWHAPVGKSAPVDSTGRPMLVLRSINRNDKVELVAATDAGGFSARDLDRAAYALRAMSGDEHPIEPRTLNIIYRIQAHFQAAEIRIVSGYRVPKANSHSNHGKGRAIDFIVPGTPDADVARFAREIGFVGVGIYPTSQFIHVDVRPRSYFWIDSSGPGKRNRERGILADLAIASDKRATERGERGIAPFLVAPDVDLALKARGPVPPAPIDDDDEDGD